MLIDEGTLVNIEYSLKEFTGKVISVYDTEPKLKVETSAGKVWVNSQRIIKIL